MKRRNFTRENHRWGSTGVGQVSGTLINHANPERSSTNDIKVVENVQRLESEESTNNLSTSVQPQKFLGEDIV